MSTDTDRIEADIADSRHRLNDTLSALSSKLSPGQMLDEALGLAQGQAGRFATNLGRQVRDNPLPAVLMAAGALMYFANRNSASGAPDISAHEWSSDSAARAMQEARWSLQRRADESEVSYSARLHELHAGTLGLKQNAGETLDAFKARVAQGVADLERTAGNVRAKVDASIAKTASALKAGAGEARDAAASAFRDVQARYDENPLVAGAVAAAAGAILGALAPLTQMERDNLAGVADVVAKKGVAFADAGASLVENAVDALN